MSFWKETNYEFNLSITCMIERSPSPIHSIPFGFQIVMLNVCDSKKLKFFVSEKLGKKFPRKEIKCLENHWMGNNGAQKLHWHKRIIYYSMLGCSLPHNATRTHIKMHNSSKWPKGRWKGRIKVPFVPLFPFCWLRQIHCRVLYVWFHRTFQSHSNMRCSMHTEFD